MKETGCVVSVKDEAAIVAMPVSKECESCGACLMAGSGKELLLLATNPVGASEGDNVEVEIASGRVLAAAFIIYMIPILLTIVGFLIGSAIAGGSADSGLPIVLAVVFLVASFIGVWLYDMRLRRVERRQAVITRIIDRQQGGEEQSKISKVKLGG